MPIPYREPHEVKGIPTVPNEVVNLFLTLQNTTTNNVKTAFGRLDCIYQFMDRFNKYVSTFTVCTKGCSHCCKIDVHISTLEAEYIANHLKIEIDNSSAPSTGHNSPCPFLGDDQGCTIYKFRPFNCRAFHTLDHPKYCADGTNHAMFGSSFFNYGSPILFALADYISQINNNQPKKDIRNFFPKRP